jgi:hypothetical protein
MRKRDKQSAFSFFLIYVEGGILYSTQRYGVSP